MRVVPLLLVLIAGCQPPPDAPTELGALSRYLFRSFDDDAAMVAGLDELQRWLAGRAVTEETPLVDRAWALPVLDGDDVSGLPAHPDRDGEGLIGLGSAFVSAHGPACHARVHVDADQLDVEPNAERYDRRFPEAPDPTCFPARRCERVLAVSDVRRANLVLTLDFELNKVYRWLDVDAGAAIVARSWSERPYEGQGGVLWQSYAADVWIPRPDGGSWRYQAHWSETEIHGFGDTRTIQLDLNRKATEDTMVATDDVLDARCGAGG